MYSIVQSIVVVGGVDSFLFSLDDVRYKSKILNAE